jgi:hypothetical protein
MGGTFAIARQAVLDVHAVRAEADGFCRNLARRFDRLSVNGSEECQKTTRRHPDALMR